MKHRTDRVKRIHRLTTLLALLSAVMTAQSPSDLHGWWESAVRNEAGIGMVLEFRPGGALAMHTTAFVELEYRLTGELLVSTFRDPETGTLNVDTSVVSVAGDTLTRTSVSGLTERMVRVKKPGELWSGVHGTWSFHRGPRAGTMRFTPDGREYFRLAAGTEEATYEIMGPDLVITTNGSDRNSFRWRVSGDSLYLHRAQGAPQVYLRWD